MVRILTVAVLAANLLVCPLRCLSCGIDASGSDAAESIYEPCCHECENASGNNDTSSDDCSCPNCICEGATIESVCLETQEAEPAFADWLIRSTGDFFYVSSVVATESPPIGLDVSTFAVHQVWLI